MINLFMMIAILFVNVIAVVLTYQFIKVLDKKEKVIFIAIAVAVNYMIVSGVYALSGIGIDKVVTQSAQNFVTYMFVPVNMILVMPFIASTYSKFKLNKIKKEPLRNRIIAIAGWAILILVVEYFYFRSIALNISNYSSIL